MYNLEAYYKIGFRIQVQSIGIAIGKVRDRVRRGWTLDEGVGSKSRKKPFSGIFWHSWLFLGKPWKASCQLPPLSTLAS